MARGWAATMVWVCWLAAAIACAQGTRAPTLIVAHEWAGKGQWVRADTHMHTRASDGAEEVEPLVAKAREHGCDAVAITDHADRQLRAGTPEYLSAIVAARAAHPETLVIQGLEWNVPPSGGNEHATLLVPDLPAAGALLAEFKKRFDDYDREDGTKPSAEAALTWLAEASRPLPVRPVVVYNHPSRKDQSSRSNIDDIVRWRKTNDLVIGFEGGPGHQGKAPLGSYTGNEETIDRWDPVVARPGDAWDTLLGRGVDLHGAIASSDFHSAQADDLNDFWPCQFAETWYYVPEKTTNGLLRGMRAGTFFGAHGHIVRHLELTVVADGLKRPAMVGEAIEVAVGTEIIASLKFEVPDTDWQQQANQIDIAEMILVTPSKVDTREQKVAAGGSQAVSERVVVGKDGVVIRARVRRIVSDGPDLLAYTNAIRIRSR